ncbi:PIG-L deacetylase family protein [Bacteroidota bacterium]
MKTFTLIGLLLFTSCISNARKQLNVLVIFAHPDEGEIYTGGTSALYTRDGHKVKFLSLTNGDAGHYEMKPEDLAKRRLKEAMKAKEVLKLVDYEVLNNHDGVLRNTEENRDKVIQCIKHFKADIVFTYYPAEGGHNDNMTAGWIVREAAPKLKMGKMPVFVYVRDFHTTRFSFIPDIAIIIDEVWEIKLVACGAHESQVIEFNPNLEGVLEEVLASKEKQKEFLFHNTYPYSMVTNDNRLTLEKWYGNEKASKVKYVEAFEIAEFGRQVSDEEILEFFPMINAEIEQSGSQH